jgi:phosphate-selective porin OprO/OprP
LQEPQRAVSSAASVTTAQLERRPGLIPPGCKRAERLLCGGILVLLLSLSPPRAVAQQVMQDRMSHPIHSLLLEKESPLLGIHWGGELFVDAPLGDEPPGAELTLRRAKLKFHRKLGFNWQVKLTANYNKGGNFELDDSYFVFTGWSTALIKLGFTTPPFSLESVSGSASQTFLEEALPVAALAESRGGGIFMIKRTSKSILNASLTILNPDQEGLSSSGQALVLHYVHAPIDLVGRKGVSLGASVSYRVNSRSEDSRFRSRPEIATANTYFVDTGEIDGADKVFRAGIEASQVRGRFSWQSELLTARVNRQAMSTTRFWGAYVYASWFLTNDVRNYDLGQGQFSPQEVSNPVLKDGWGAFELAGRASYVDLQDSDVNGGRETNLSLGLNWYLNDKFRLSGNVVKVLNVDRPGSEFDGSDPTIWAVRAQWLVY